MSVPSPPAEAVGESEWLAVVNLYRASAGLNPVVENPAASAGAQKHSAYLVRNRIIGHEENPKDPGYSPEGRRAGLTGNVAAGWGSKLPAQRYLIEEWMTAPFHGLGMLNPSSTNFGFGVAAKGRSWAATLPVFWDDYQDPDVAPVESNTGSREAFERAYDLVIKQHPELADQGFSASSRGDRIVVTIAGRHFLVVGDEVTELPAGTNTDDTLDTTHPTVVWPGNGSAVPVNRYYGTEWPDPVVSCKGYTNKTTGLPLLIRRGKPTELSSVAMTDSTGRLLQTCVITAETYRNPNKSDQKYASYILEVSGEAIIMPKGVLTPGMTYRVIADTTDGEHLDWSFTISTDGAIHPPAGHALADRPTPGVPSQVKAKKKT